MKVLTGLVAVVLLLSACSAQGVMTPRCQALEDRNINSTEFLEKLKSTDQETRMLYGLHLANIKRAYDNFTMAATETEKEIHLEELNTACGDVTGIVDLILSK